MNFCVVAAIGMCGFFSHSLLSSNWIKFSCQSILFFINYTRMKFLLFYTYIIKHISVAANQITFHYFTMQRLMIRSTKYRLRANIGRLAIFFSLSLVVCCISTCEKVHLFFRWFFFSSSFQDPMVSTFSLNFFF